MIARLIGFGLIAYGGYLLMTKTTANAALTMAWDTAPAFDADADVVARTIWGEARGEGWAGMQAVACVIANRVARPGWWGRGWRGVCLARLQFSCWNGNDANSVKVAAVNATDPQFVAAMEIAAAAVAGQLPDITGGATHYFNPSVVSPSWAREMIVTAQIGNHVFLA